MKILQIGKYYYPHMGGIENHLYILSNELVRHGHDVTVFVSNDSNKYEEDSISGVKVFRYPEFFRILNAPISFFKKIDRKDFDIIHVHLPNPMASIYALFNSGDNLIVTYHSDVIKGGIVGKILNSLYTHFFLKPLLTKADKILATSQNYVSGSKILQDYSGKVEIVPYGIDLDIFNHDDNRSIIKELKSNYKNKKVLLFIGRLVPYKGLEYLIYAMTEVVSKFRDTKLIIVGDGPLTTKLKELVLRLRLNDYVEFVSGLHNTKTPPYYHLSDVFVLPSVYKAEAFGIVQLEAMACGKPIISTSVDGSGISFVNQNNKTGIVVTPRNPKALSDAIKKLLKAPKLRKTFGNNGKERVEKYFSKQVMVRKILDSYESILKRLKGI